MDNKWLAAAAALGLAGAGMLSGCDRAGAAQGGLTAEQQGVFDRLAIEDLVTRYYENFGATDAAEQFGTYYTEDAVFDVNGVVSSGREEIEALYTSMDSEGDAPAAQGTFHMIISNPVIDINGDTATARFMWTGVMNADIKARPQLFEQGREYDALVKRDGKWLIQKRTVIADSGLPERFAATYQPRKDYDITK